MTQVISGFDYPGDGISNFKLTIHNSLLIIVSSFSSLLLNFCEFFLLPPDFLASHLSFFLLLFLLDFLVKGHLLYKMFAFITSDLGGVNFDVKTILLALNLYLFFLILTEMFFLFYAIFLVYRLLTSFFNLLNNFLPHRSNPLDNLDLHPFPGFTPKTVFVIHHGSTVKFDDQFIYTNADKYITVFDQSDLQTPLFILKGHKLPVQNLFVTNQFLLSQPSGLDSIGLWDKSDSFAFSNLYEHLYPLKKSASELVNFQIANDRCYFRISNVIYSNTLDFQDPSQIVMSVDEDIILEEFVIYNDSIYCLFFGLRPYHQRINVYNLSDKTLQGSKQIKWDGNQNNLLSYLVVTSHNVISSGSYRMHIYNREDNLSSLKEVDFYPEDISFIGANKHYYVLYYFRINGKPNGVDNIIQIYSNDGEFELLKEFMVNDVKLVQIDPDFDYLIVGIGSAVIQRYSISDLVSW